MAKASSLMEGVEGEIGRKKEVSRRVSPLRTERPIWPLLISAPPPFPSCPVNPPPPSGFPAPQVKALSSEIAAAEHEAQQLEAQHQHLKRQQAALQVGGSGRAGLQRQAGELRAQRLCCSEWRM